MTIVSCRLDLSIVLKINTAIKITISHISRITHHVVSRYNRLGWSRFRRSDSPTASAKRLVPTQLAQHLKDLDPNGQRLNSRTIARIETEQQDTIRQYSLQLRAQAFDSQSENLRNQTSISATDDPFFQLFQLQFRTIIDTEYS